MSAFFSYPAKKRPVCQDKQVIKTVKNYQAQKQPSP